MKRIITLCTALCCLMAAQAQQSPNGKLSLQASGHTLSLRYEGQHVLHIETSVDLSPLPKPPGGCGSSTASATASAAT
ncbi:MAG: hypothetical protein IJ588_07180 [Prevotella sp.]|nr:hypothetical protein [Prevotella sp.]